MDILQQDIMYLTGVGPHRKEILRKELGISTYGDLLEYYPYKYIDRTKVYRISELVPDIPYVQIKGHILSFEEFDMGRRKKRIVAHFSDGHGVCDLVWFNGTQYIYKNYFIGKEYVIFGKPSIYNQRFQFTHPDIDDASELQLNNMGMQPFYTTTEKMKKSGITSHTIEKLTKTLLEKLVTPLPETLPNFITQRLHLISRNDALRKIHYPNSVDDTQRAQVRLKFEELFYVQLNILRYASDQRRKYKGYYFKTIGTQFNWFYTHNLPFELTNAQKRVMKEIRADMGSGKQMNRLLQGDVGSGKTLVALMSMLIAVDNGFQACLMAPTEILAEQHLQTLKDLLKGMNLRIELLTGIVKGKKRKEVMDGLIDGSIHIAVGTHAIIEDKVQFNNLGLAVIDEQHRFGVEQRDSLRTKGKNHTTPHLLVMTATPIPRTIAMTFFGDLNHSTLSELPGGRRPIKSYVVPEYLPKYTTRAYEVMREHIHQGHQIYIVCPRINGPGGVLETHQHLSETEFKNYRIGLLHGQLKDADKDTIMRQFANGDLDILIATTVIEVGIDVPNATIIMIRESENLGVSQLHQLRGRVGRGGYDSICFFHHTAERGTPADKRIWQMAATTDGFQVAEIDLIQRHEGDVLGTSQSGTNRKIAFLNLARDIGLINRANRDAKNIVAHNLDLARQLIAGIDDITQDYLDKS